MTEQYTDEDYQEIAALDSKRTWGNGEARWRSTGDKVWAISAIAPSDVFYEWDGDDIANCKTTEDAQFIAKAPQMAAMIKQLQAQLQTQAGELEAQRVDLENVFDAKKELGQKLKEAKGISRQRKWQKKKEREGNCRICGKPAVTKGHCEKHRLMINKMSLASWRKKQTNDT